MTLRDKIEKYVPFNKEEASIKEYMLEYIDTFEDVLTRDNHFGHFASSAFVVDKNREKMLTVYHNIYDSWIFPGGHADGEEDLLSVAIREVEEETGTTPRVLDDSIYAISADPIITHAKRGKVIPAHTHLGVLYLLEVDDTAALTFRSDESKGIKWTALTEATGENIVDFARPINERMIKKLSLIKK